jgi:hypothetical protein
MTTYIATYENGRIIFDEKPKIKKSKVKVIFFDEPDENNGKKTFPSEDLGDINNISRKSLYDKELLD